MTQFKNEPIACLAQVIYYPSNESLPRRDAFEAIWEACGIFGNDRVLEYLWTPGTVNDGQRPRKPRLGDLKRLRELVSTDASHIYGGLDSVYKGERDPVVHTDFSFGFHKAGYWGTGPTLPKSHFDVSETWFQRVSLEAYLRLVRLHFTLADEYLPASGFIDVSDREDTLGGAAFGSVTYIKLPLHRWIEQARWIESLNSGGGKLRSVYWGNYIGKAILDRLGGQDFLDRYRKQATWADGSANAHIWEFPNGSFLSVCFDPSGCFPGRRLDAAARDNSIWLVREFLKAGVLS